MSLIDVLACPKCKVQILLKGDMLKCDSCGISYPIINGVPVILPNGEIPNIEHEAELQVRTNYDPWVHRVILQSLLDDQIILDIGSGNMSLDDPNIIRMDVTLSPYVDLVADVHNLPFLPESVDYIFSLAVFEHLRNPFQAASSIYEALKDGGYIYHECNFVFSYHGYPNHYFNASLQGLEQIFANFMPLRKGVAPYQMPSFSLEMVLHSYLKNSIADQFQHGRKLTTLLRQILSKNLTEYDIYFDEGSALNVAAGTYYSGMKKKSSESTLIPKLMHNLWEKEEDLQIRFPDINNLTTTENILIWAREEGRVKYPELAEYFQGVKPFNKRGENAVRNRKQINSMPYIEPKFGAVGLDPDVPLAQTSKLLLDKSNSYENKKRGGAELVLRGLAILRRQGVKTFLIKVVDYLRARRFI